MSLTARIAATFNRSGTARDKVVVAAAMPAVSHGSKGSGAPSSRRAPLALIAALAAIAVLAFTAAPALAAPLSAEMGAVSSPSYTTAQVTGKITTPGDPIFATGYSFEYSTDEVNWFGGGGGSIGTGAVEGKTVKGEITVPKGGTKYFVRLTASIPLGPSATSPGPNPSFTTLPVDPPTIPGTVEASPVFSLSAKASAKVKRPANENAAFDVKCHFEYISDAQYEENVNVNSLPGFAGATPIDCEQSPITSEKVDAGGEAEVSAPITGLSPSTAYRLRLIAENAGGVVTKDAATFTTAPPVAKPTVIAANDATDVSYRTAKVSGTVERPAGADPALDIFSCRFEFITDQQFDENEANSLPGFEGAGQTQCLQTEAGPITSAGPTPTPVSANLAGLQSKTGVTYHLRLVAENAGGTDAKDATNTFTTLGGGDATFTLDTDATVAGYTTLEFFGTVTRGLGGEDEDLRFVFEFAEVGTENWNECCYLIQPVPTGPGAHNVSYKFTDLTSTGGEPPKPGTEYKYRLTLDGQGWSYTAPPPGPYPTVATRPLEKPTATIDPVTSITGTSAHFSGTVDTHAPAGPLDGLGKAAYKTEWHFECTPTCNDAGGKPLGGTVQGEEGNKAISIDAKGLDANTSYEVKLVANNDFYSAETPVQTFKTPLVKPTVKAAAGASDGKGGYTLQGIVNPNGSNVSDCKFAWGPNSADYAFTADCSPTPGGKAQPVTVEVHLTGLNPGVVYHYNLLATNSAGTGESGDQEFIPTLSPPENCPNQQLRKENSSLALPECRAYEMVTPSGKEGFRTALLRISDDRVNFGSNAPNLAKSGPSVAGFVNKYVAERSSTGWETISNLNGSSGTLKDAPSLVTSPSGPHTYSADLLSSMWNVHRKGDSASSSLYLRRPDGLFTLVGSGVSANVPAGVELRASDDLSHVVVGIATGFGPTEWGLGVYEYVGTGVTQPRRVDVDNSGTPISACLVVNGDGMTANFRSISADGRTIVVLVGGGCGGANPPAQEIWARVGGTTSFDVSASQCTRVDCNGPSNPTFRGAAKDGSRIFFTTTQQLLDADVDQATDLYACDIPSGEVSPGAGKANHCAALRQVSGGDPTSAGFESFATLSDNGATAVFTAKGVLADNEDALGEQALAGDHNLYAWRTDAAHPAGQTTFVARLDSDDLTGFIDGNDQRPQTTPDGRYLVFSTATRLVETDTDTARDVYRYDADSGQLTRVSTNVFGTAGNSDDFNAAAPAASAVSNDGTKIVFKTTEALSPVDGNAEVDLYLWTPTRVSLITTGAVGSGILEDSGYQGSFAFIDGSGQNIYFVTEGALTPADGDNLGDVYDARIGGGFSFAPPEVCVGENCQPDPEVRPETPLPKTELSPPDGGNVKPKTCGKGKVLKKGKCVRKHKKKSHKNKRTAGHNRGGNK